MERIEKYESWAIVELLGHKKLAGFVSEQTIAGSALIRIDVPETPVHERYHTQFPGSQAYTKLVGVGSVYAITPCTEALARAAAVEIERYNQPVPVDLPKLIPDVTGEGRTEAEVSSAYAEDESADEDDDLLWDRNEGDE